MSGKLNYTDCAIALTAAELLSNRGEPNGLSTRNEFQSLLNAANKIITKEKRAPNVENNANQLQNIINNGLEFGSKTYNPQQVMASLRKVEAAFNDGPKPGGRGRDDYNYISTLNNDSKKFGEEEYLSLKDFSIYFQKLQGK
jgi:hypothetical protein